MDALRQQDVLRLLRNDGIVDSLGNEASFFTSSELIMTSLFSYISIKKTQTYVFDISLNQESSYCKDGGCF